MPERTKTVKGPNFVTPSTRNKKLEKYAKTPFMLNGKPGDNVLLVADTETDESTSSAIVVLSSANVREPTFVTRRRRGSTWRSR